MEKLLEEISFTASDSPGRKIEIDAAYVREQVGELAKNADLASSCSDLPPAIREEVRVWRGGS